MAAEKSGESTKPRRLPFPLQEGESIVVMQRRHWIYLWPMIVFQLLAALLPIGLLYWLFERLGALEGIVSSAFLVVAVLYFAYWAVRMVLTWYRYTHDVWVVTNQRLIDTHRRHPFDMAISTADLVNVQDMSIQRTGILRTVLDFGDVICQTASIDQDFMIGGVPKPREVQALVDRERDRERARIRAI